MYKIIGVDQQEYGPVNAQELRSWIAEGRANAQSMVRMEGGDGGWRPLGSYPEFVAALNANARNPVATVGVAKTNGFAITGFVMSLLSLLCCFAGPLFSLLGLVFSILGLVQIGRTPGQAGRGLAITGIILSILGLLLFGSLMLLGAIGSVLQDVSYQ